MTSDLHKRLEEAAEKAINCEVCPIGCWKKNCKSTCSTRTNVIIGAELGYKEAIKVAKEWMRYNVHRYIYAVNEDGIPQAGIGAAKFSDDFETYMNKSLEEKK